MAQQIRISIYIDSVFIYKTEIFNQSNNPILDLKLKVVLPEDSHEIRFDIYDAD